MGGSAGVVGNACVEGAGLRGNQAVSSVILRIMRGPGRLKFDFHTGAAAGRHGRARGAKRLGGLMMKSARRALSPGSTWPASWCRRNWPWLWPVWCSRISCSVGGRSRVSGTSGESCASALVSKSMLIIQRCTGIARRARGPYKYFT